MRAQGIAGPTSMCVCSCVLLGRSGAMVACVGTGGTGGIFRSPLYKFLVPCLCLFLPCISPTCLPVCFVC